MRMCKRCGKVEVNGAKVYCTFCAKEMQRLRSNAWYHNHPEVRAKKLPEPEKVSTSLYFLDAINKQLKAAKRHGLSYGEYKAKNINAHTTNRK